jgi:hypothetical protein
MSKECPCWTYLDITTLQGQDPSPRITARGTAMGDYRLCVLMEHKPKPHAHLL